MVSKIILMTSKTNQIKRFCMGWAATENIYKYMSSKMVRGELSVLFIHEDPFQFREVLLHRLNIPRILSLFYQFTSSGSKQVSAKVEAPNLWNFWIWSVLSK